MSNDQTHNPIGAFSMSALSLAVSGVAVPVEGSGYIAFDVPIIYHSTTATAVPVKVIRRNGVLGSLTVSITLQEKFNSQGILNSAPIPLTFVEGEVVKDVVVPLNDLVLDGECHIQMTINSGPIEARFNEVNTIAIVDTGTIQAAGTVLSDPANDSIQASLTEGTVVYLRNGTWNEAASSGYVPYGPEGASAEHCLVDKSNVVIRNYPGESPLIDIPLDWGNPSTSGPNEGDPASVGNVAFYVTSCDYVHIYGFEITGRMGIYVREWITPPAEGVDDQFYCHFHSNHIHHVYGADNVGALRLDDAYRCVVFNNYLHHIYDSRLTHRVENGVDAEGMDHHSGIHGYRPRECYIYQNTLHNVGRGIYRKDPHRLGLTKKSHAVMRNLFYDVSKCALEFNYAGTSIYQDGGGLLAENILISHSTQLSNLLKLESYPSDVSGTDCDAYNNTQIGGYTDSFSIESWTDVKLWNNYSSKGALALLVNNLNPEGTSITYMDYNGFLSDGTPTWQVSRYGDNTTFTGLTSWQAQDGYTSGTVSVVTGADANSLAGDPLFTDEANKDLTLQVGSPYIGAGRFGDDIGAYRLGHEQIGATI